MAKAAGQVTLTVDRDAAAELRVAKAEMSRDRDRVPTLSEVIRTLVTLWRESTPAGSA